MTSQIFKQSTLFVAVTTVLMTTVSAYAVNSTTSVSEDNLPTVTLPTITVTAKADSEQSDGPVQGIAASTSSSITGFDESILKSPQSVTVVGKQEIDTIGSDSIQNVLGYVSGIVLRDYDTRMYDDYAIRGFRSYKNIYRDGQRFNVGHRSGTQDIYGLERVEVIKGPNSVLSGAMIPGGAINTVSKKPYFANSYEINAELGSFNHRQVSADINQVLTDDIAVRLVGVYRDSDTFLDYVPDDGTYIAPSITWQPSDNTKLTLQADYQHIETAYAAQHPIIGSLDTRFGKIPIGVSAVIPGFDKFDTDRYSFGYEVSHQFNPDLLIKHNLRRSKGDGNNNRTIWDWAIDEKQGLYTGYAWNTKLKEEVTTSALSAQYNWSIANNIENVTLIGLDYTDAKLEWSDFDATDVSNINLFNPNYSQRYVDKFVLSDWASVEKTTQTGIYVQNQLTYNDKIVALIGLRHDKAKLSDNWPRIPEYSTKTDQSATTGRAGLVYLMDNGIAPYASISQSFEPETGKDRGGNLFEPTEGEQYEVGVRYQPEGKDTLLTASLYRINKTNETVDDPVDDDYEIQTGETRSQGVELEARTQLGDNANFIAAYSYTDARTIKASPLYPEKEGIRNGQVPYNAFSMWGDYRFTDFGLPKLKMGAGLKYTGSTVKKGKKLDIPDYTLVDAMASYDWNKNLKLSLNVKNLFDEETLVCYRYCKYLEPRNVVGKVTYKW